MPANWTLQSGTLKATLANDNWTRLVDLFGVPGSRIRAKSCVLAVLANGGDVFFQADGGVRPTNGSADGDSLSAGAKLGMGPNTDPDGGEPINRIWIRNTSAGSNATFVLYGVWWVC